MGIKSLNWAFDLVDIPDNPPAKLVLIVLANYADNDIGTCYPSIKTLQKKTGFSRSTVIRYIDDLESRVLVTRIHRKVDLKHLSTIYLLSSHAAISKYDFTENHGFALKLSYEDYEAAVKKRASLATALPSLSAALALVSERDPNPNLNPDLNLERERGQDLPQTRVGLSRPALALSKGALVNDHVMHDFDDLMTWLKNKKSMRHLPEQEYLTLLIELEKNGINMSEFRRYYEWIEKQPWLRGTVSTTLLLKNVEAYVNRHKIEERDKNRGAKNGKSSRGTSMSEYLRELDEAG